MFRLATERPVAVFMITAAVALFGALSYRQLGLELMPDLAYPTLTVRTQQDGAAPEEIEAEITHPLEQQVGTVEALKGMHSSSRAGVSEVVLEFDWDADMDRAAQRVRERLGRIELPDAADAPQLLRYDPALVPVLSLALSGGNGLTTLRTWAEEELTPALSKVEGVAAVRVLGGLEREIQVRLDAGALAARGLSVQTVAQRLAAANVNLAGGRLREGSVEFLVRTLAELRTAEELGEVVVASTADGAILRLADVATLVTTTRERRAVVRVAGDEAVRIDIFRQAGANIVEVCDRIRAAVFGTAAQQAWMTDRSAGPASAPPSGKGSRRAQAQAAARRRAMIDFIAWRKPEGSRLDVLSDQSTFIRAALDEVSGAALSGGLLAVLVLFLFLRSGYSTFIVGIAIPLSVAVTFAPLMLFGVGLNIMSLGGLALGIGMLVDNSIVVLESIFRCQEEGDPPRAAAVRGAQEVGGAVVASTLTTVAVFFPIAFVEGVAGQIFGDLALAVVFSLLASLVVALFVVPMLAALRVGTGSHPGTTGPVGAAEAPRQWNVTFRALPRWWASRRGRFGAVLLPLRLPLALLEAAFELLGNVLVLVLGLVAAPAVLLWRGVRLVARLLLGPPAWATNLAVDALRDAYARVLRVALRRPVAVVAVTAAVAWGAWLSARHLGAELVPEVRQGVLVAEMRFPVGTPLDETERRSAIFEAAAAELPGVARVEAFVGEPEAGEDSGGERGPHTSAVTVRLRPDPDRDGVAAEADLADRLRALGASVPDLDLEITRPSLFSLRPPIRAVILGHHLGQLAVASNRVQSAIAAVPGVGDVQQTMRPGYPEVQVQFDRMRLAALNLTPRQVAEGIRGQVDGDVATELRQAAERVEVRVKLDPARTDRREALGALVINPGAKVTLPLDAVARLEDGVGPAEIRHVDGQRAALVTAQTDRFDLGSTAAAVALAVADVDLPAGFEVRLQGQDEEMKTSLDSLKLALLLAIFLVYVVMASQFESLRAPLVIMGSLPLAGIGVFYALGLSGTPVSVVVFVGLITLAGIVVNNAIVLVDYANQLQGRGVELDEALVTAGATRLRPILMTTLTTVLGLLPMAFGGGEGTELRAPIAITLVGGLACATGLTLLVIPVLYRAVVGRSAARRSQSAADPAEAPLA